MAQLAKMEAQVETKSPARSVFQTYRSKQNQLSKICPNVVKDVQLIKGDWDSVGSIGSIRRWNFAPDESYSTEFCTLRIDAADDENNSISCVVLEGELTKWYPSFVFTIQATDKEDGSGAVVKTVIHYEKKNEAVPEPSKYFNFADILFKTIDSFLINKA